VFFSVLLCSCFPVYSSYLFFSLLNRSITGAVLTARLHLEYDDMELDAGSKMGLERHYVEYQRYIMDHSSASLTREHCWVICATCDFKELGKFA